MKVKTHAIIVAAGKGIRMSNTMRKQYITLDGMPMLRRTLGVFNGCDLIDRIILAVPEDDIDYCRNEIIPAANMEKEVILKFKVLQEFFKKCKFDEEDRVLLLDEYYALINVYGGPSIEEDQLSRFVNQILEAKIRASIFVSIINPL